MEAKIRAAGSFSNTTAQETDPPESFPLHFAQERLWFFSQMYPGNPVHNRYMAVPLFGELNLEKAILALRKITGRHKILRTRFGATQKGLAQIVDLSPEPALQTLDLRLLPSERGREEAAKFTTENLAKPFDLIRGPLFRTMLILIDKHNSWLVLCLSGIISDERSVRLMLKEWASLYSSLVRNRQAALSDPCVQFGEFSREQRLNQSAHTEELRKGLEFWQQKLANASRSLKLPLDRPLPAVETFQGSSVGFTLPPHLMARLRTWREQRRYSLETIILATWVLLLYRYSGQTDLVVGIPGDSRGRRERDAIGCFTNTLITRLDVTANPTLAELVTRVKHVVEEAYEYRNLPIELLYKKLFPNALPGRDPLLQVFCDAGEATPLEFGMSLEGSPASKEGGSVSFSAIHNHTARLELSLKCRWLDARFHGSIEYKSDVFHADNMTRMTQHLVTVIESLIASPHTPIDRVTILPQGERQRLLVTFNDTGSEDSALSFVQLFRNQAARNPNGRAVLFEGRSLSYKELNRETDRFARILLEKGACRGQPVPVYLERGLERVVAMLAVLKAGAIYLPLASHYPRDWLQSILEDPMISLLITHEALVHRIPSNRSRVVHPILDSKEGPGPDHQDSIRSIENDSKTGSILLYTPGPTESPTGVLVCQEALSHLLAWAREVYPVHGEDLFLHQSSCVSDLSILELLWPLSTGAGVVMAGSGSGEDITSRIRLIRENKVAVGFARPNELARILDDPGAGQCTSLKHFFVGGGPVPVALSQAFSSLLDAALHPFYGFAETTVVAATAREKFLGNRRTAPLGRPLTNTRFFILDPHFEPTPIGIAGELFIGGVSLARGYHHRPERTTERFLPDPFSGVPGERLYRTKDLVRYDPNGILEYQGYNGRQVESQGFRVSLSAIETVLHQHASLVDGALAIHPTENMEHCLVAHLIAKGGNTLSKKEWLTFLKDRLPGYMHPAYFMYHERFPQTGDGRLDREAFPAPLPEKEPNGSEYVAPRDPYEAKLGRIWEALLKIDRVGAMDNFFDLGGHSMTTARLIKTIDEEFGIRVELHHFLKIPTLARLAKHIREKASERGRD